MERAGDCVVERLDALGAGTVADLDALIRELKPAWPPLTEERLVALIGSESRVYVARDGDRIVGLTVMVPHHHLAGLRYHVEDVVVASDRRRAGIGRRLLECAMRDVPGPVVSFDLRSHASREDAHRLYAALGFRPSDTTVFRLEVPPGAARGRP